MTRVELVGVSLIAALVAVVGCGGSEGDGGAGGGGGTEPPDGQWGDPVLLETSDAGTANGQRVAVDPNGNVTAVWGQNEGARRSIWSSRFTPSGGWGEAQLIETDDAGDSSGATVAVDPNGNAVAVWRQSDGTGDDNIWSNRFTPSGGWGVAELVETDDASDVGWPEVAVDPNGNAVAVWTQDDDGTGDDNIWSNRFTPSGGWGEAELLETDDTSFAGGPDVAVDADGNAIAVWRQHDGTRGNIWSNRFTPSGGWGEAEPLETDAGDAYGAKVALDPNGNAVAVWSQSDGTRNNIWSNRFTPSGGWGEPELICTSPEYFGQEGTLVKRRFMVLA